MLLLVCAATARGLIGLTFTVQWDGGCMSLGVVIRAPTRNPRQTLGHQKNTPQICYSPAVYCTTVYTFSTITYSCLIFKFSASNKLIM
jgi:hypothetical protein